MEHRLGRRRAVRIPPREPFREVHPVAALPENEGVSALGGYLAAVQRFPLLSPEEEYVLACRVRDHHDRAAAHLD